MGSGTVGGFVRRGRRVALAALAAVAAGLAGTTAAAAQAFEDPVAITVENATAKVGETTAVRATLTPREGFGLTDVYRHRIIKLSTDGGVAFEDEVVAGKMDDGKVVFSVAVTPTYPGTHVINGVFRYSVYQEGHLEMKSAPLIATVTGTP
ncbi:MAG TPA: hypothetical protein VGB88_08780 [Alphaproteobacteria bacterium]